MLALLAHAGTAGQGTAAEIPGPSTSDEARREATAAIPLARISPQLRPLVEEVVTDPSLYRRMPTSVVDCRPLMFTYLVENPEVLVEIWRQLGISKVQMERLDDTSFRVADNAGASGILTIAEHKCDDQAQNRLTLFVDGQYEGPPFQRPLQARTVLLLRSGSVVEENGRPFVAARLDAFVKFDRASLELVAKLAQPLLGTTADRNFTDTLTFVSNLSLTAERRPQAIDRLAGDLQGIDAARREQFVRVAFDCADRGLEWRDSQARAAIDQASLELPRR
jgi:hypothetical protein